MCFFSRCHPSVDLLGSLEWHKNRNQHSGTTTWKGKQGKKTMTNNKQIETIVENVNSWQKESEQVRGKCCIKREEKRVRGREIFQQNSGQLWLGRRAPSLSKTKPFRRDFQPLESWRKNLCFLSFYVCRINILGL